MNSSVFFMKCYVLFNISSIYCQVESSSSQKNEIIIFENMSYPIESIQYIMYYVYFNFNQTRALYLYMSFNSEALFRHGWVNSLTTLMVCETIINRKKVRHPCRAEVDKPIDYFFVDGVEKQTMNWVILIESWP